jgi:hypothetical protein
MALTKKIWIQKAVELANRGVDPSASALIDVDSAAEPLLENVLVELAREYVTKGHEGLLPRLKKTIAFVNGTGALSDDVLQSCLEGSTLTDPTEASENRKVYSYVPEWDDFIDAYERRIGYYCVPVSQVITIIEPDEDYDPVTGLTGNRELTIACVWTIPAGLDTDMGFPTEVEMDAIAKLAEALQGEAISKAA